MEKFIEFLKAVFLHKRMKALYWSAGTMCAAALAAVVPEVLADFSAPSWLVVAVGLAAAQVTKALNTPKP